MKSRLLFLLLVTGLIVLALGGWTVQGLRWAVSGARSKVVLLEPHLVVWA